MSVQKHKTGIYYVKDPAGVVVMHKGRQIHRYQSVEELVQAHVDGIDAIEKEREKLIAAQYLPDNLN